MLFTKQDKSHIAIFAEKLQIIRLQYTTNNIISNSYRTKKNRSMSAKLM